MNDGLSGPRGGGGLTNIVVVVVLVAAGFFAWSKGLIPGGGGGDDAFRPSFHDRGLNSGQGSTILDAFSSGGGGRHR